MQQEQNMDYSIIELEFNINEGGDIDPLFKVVDTDNNELFFGNTQEECEDFIDSL